MQNISKTYLIFIICGSFDLRFPAFNYINIKSELNISSEVAETCHTIYITTFVMGYHVSRCSSKQHTSKC